MMNQMSSMVGPMTRNGRGMPMGIGMEEGMGMLRGGNATSEDKGTSLGRGMGVGSTRDQNVANGSLSGHSAQQGQDAMPGMQHERMQMPAPEVPKDASSIPGFPQDAFMEGPAMAMDKLVEKPDNYGLRPGWSGFMQGMMTFLRVLPPEMYDKVMALREQKNRTSPNMPDMQRHGG